MHSWLYSSLLYPCRSIPGSSKLHAESMKLMMQNLKMAFRELTGTQIRTYNVMYMYVIIIILWQTMVPATIFQFYVGSTISKYSVCRKQAHLVPIHVYIITIGMRMHACACTCQSCSVCIVFQWTVDPGQDSSQMDA